MLPESKAKHEKKKNIRTFVTIHSEHLTMPTAVLQFFFPFFKNKNSLSETANHQQDLMYKLGY
jgi:hypothetical protein